MSTLVTTFTGKEAFLHRKEQVTPSCVLIFMHQTRKPVVPPKTPSPGSDMPHLPGPDSENITHTLQPQEAPAALSKPNLQGVQKSPTLKALPKGNKERRDGLRCS